jgi:23S rRNA (cytosine1962-C5)-methyltransferase
MDTIILKPQRERSLKRRHPWVFSGAVQSAEGEPQPGGTVALRAADGAWLACGAYSGASEIRVRVWSFDPKDEVGPAFLRSRIERAVAARAALVASDVSGCRLVFGESDLLPGLIVDRYGDFLVCQFLTVGAERWKQEIVQALMAVVKPVGIFERSDADARAKEGLAPAIGVLAGAEPPELIEIREGSNRFLVDVRGGQKTGFYLDQRENRAVFGEYCRGATVLNAFSYTGGFGVSALRSGATRVVNVESARGALDLGRRNLALNGFDPNAAEELEGDVFQVLRRFRDARRSFDAIVLDPPKFAESKGQLGRASRGYKDINLLAFKLLKPGGYLFTFSCSGAMPEDLFQKIVADAALDAGRAVQLVRRLHQAADHPVLLSFPEAAYLKGLVCRAE